MSDSDSDSPQGIMSRDQIQNSFMDMVKNTNEELKSYKDEKTVELEKVAKIEKDNMQKQIAAMSFSLDE